MLKSAQRFSNTPVYDAYTGALLYYGRLAAHDDHSSSGATSRRRTLTTDPATAAPARAAVLTLGEHWLVGTSNVDQYKGVDIRRSYDLKKATDLANMLSPAEACLASDGTQAYVRREWYRDQLDAVTSSEYDTMWNVFIAAGELPARGKYIRTSDGLLRIRNSYLAQELLWIAECDQLDGPPLAATWLAKVPNPITQKDTEVPTAVNVIRLDMAKFYRYEVQSDSSYAPGDTVFMLPKTQGTPKVGDNISIAGTKYRVITVKTELDAWALKSRLA